MLSLSTLSYMYMRSACISIYTYMYIFAVLSFVGEGNTFSKKNNSVHVRENVYVMLKSE